MAAARSASRSSVGARASLCAGRRAVHSAAGSSSSISSAGVRKSPLRVAGAVVGSLAAVGVGGLALVSGEDSILATVSEALATVRVAGMVTAAMQGKGAAAPAAASGPA